MNNPKSPRRRAVALRYEPGSDAAPEVTAKGAGLVADRIVELAKVHGVPIHRDPDLAALLAKVDTGTQIPEHLYRAIAEVLAFVYRINGQDESTRELAH